MLETYFVKPQTVDRIRACWIGEEIECYVGWLSEQGYSTRTVLRRVPALMAFGEFARRRGASVPADLPAHVDDFVATRVAAHRGARCAGVTARDVATEVRGPADEVYYRPAHPYTRGLLVTIPGADPGREQAKEHKGVTGELPSAIHPPSGCRFRTRCPLAQDRCAEQESPLRAFSPAGHLAAC
jgi:oligopeptide/dipeptide ABC transporter ATP-binding protein